ncbi:hypothetical protein [Silvibacterium sp.]|uniref:hypothetical protein n=1 Tax=Silvibacterium sp. TaxID=1964179 RepID=UPI0039E41B23
MPVLEGGWTCSAACTLARMRALVARELVGYGEPAAPYRHRLPLGLLMLQRGWVDRPSLQKSLAAQRKEPGRRIGHWIRSHAKLSEQRITEALSLQWNCPVFTADFDAGVLACPPLPRILIEACGVLPLRWSATGALNVAFEAGIDHRLVLAFERLSGRRIEVGLLSDSQFARCRARLLEAPFDRVRLLEAASPEALASALARQIERVQPVEARLVRYDRYLWMRMWPKGEAEGRMKSGPGQESEDVLAVMVDFAGAS